MKILIILMLATLALIGVAMRFTSHEDPAPPAGIAAQGGGRLGESALER